MPDFPDFEFYYAFEPRIPLQVHSSSTSTTVSIDALIDTGADISVLDSQIAFELGIELDDDRVLSLRSFDGAQIEVPIGQVELILFGVEELRVRVSAAFMPGLLAGVGNLIGRDVLEHIDFALIHSSRLGYLGPTAVQP